MSLSCLLWPSYPRGGEVVTLLESYSRADGQSELFVFHVKHCLSLISSFIDFGELFLDIGTEFDVDLIRQSYWEPMVEGLNLVIAHSNGVVDSGELISLRDDISAHYRGLFSGAGQ